MDTSTNVFEPSSYLSPLYENASCATAQGGYTYYRPINTINWDTDTITTRCANDAKIQSENTNDILGWKNGWPLNSYLHTFFTNNSTIQCDNGQNPILSLKWTTENGKFTPQYRCPANDSLRFAQTKEYTYIDPSLSSFNVDEGADKNNKRFVDQTWLNKNQNVFNCPNNWYLGKMQGAVQGFNKNYHNIYKWTCGTLYNDYTNDDDVVFQWRYFNNNGDLCMRIITNIKIIADSNDQTVHEYIKDNGNYIDFDFVYNITTNTMTITAKTEKSDSFVDVTELCYIANSQNTIECNFPLTEISIVQFTFNKGNNDVVDMYETGTTITDLPMYFTSITMLQDTTLPKIYAVTWYTGNSGGRCNDQISYTKTFVEGDPIVHPNCAKLGHTATRYTEMNTDNIIATGTPVTKRLYIEPTFEPVQYNITFNNDTSDFEYIACEGTYSTTASLNEVLAPSKIPTCDGEGVDFLGWTDADNRKAGDSTVVGDMIYNPSVNYPNYTLTFNVPTGVSCRECLSARILNRRDSIGVLPVPAKEGNTFKGWFYDTSFTKPVQSTDKLTKSVTIYPKFEITRWSVNIIKPDNATLSPPIDFYELEDGRTISTLPSATLTNHTFQGLFQIYSNDILATKKWTKSTPVYDNVVLTAVFKDTNGNSVYKKYSEASDLKGNTSSNNVTSSGASNIASSASSSASSSTTASTTTINNIANNISNTVMPSSSGTSSSTSNNANNAASTTNTTANATASPATYCPADAGWPQTNIGITSELSCPNGVNGIRKRTCGANGVWGNEDITGCTKSSESAEESTTKNTTMYIIIGIIIAIIIVVMLFMSRRSGQSGPVVAKPSITA